MLSEINLDLYSQLIQILVAFFFWNIALMMINLYSSFSIADFYAVIKSLSSLSRYHHTNVFFVDMYSYWLVIFKALMSFYVAKIIQLPLLYYIVFTCHCFALSSIVFTSHCFPLSSSSKIDFLCSFYHRGTFNIFLQICIKNVHQCTSLLFFCCLQYS